MLEVIKIEDIFKNQFGYSSRTVEFYDPKNKLTKKIYIHKRHAGHYSIWKTIESDGLSSKFIGEIQLIKIDESLIRSVRAYKNSKILNFQTPGMFVIIKYSGLNDNGNLQMALKNQIYQYVESSGECFDANELTEEEFLV